jgi:hypothetical protein
MQTNPPNVNLDNDHASNQEIPEIGELASGWSSDPYLSLLHIKEVLKSFSPIHDFRKSRYGNFVPKENYTVSKEKVTRIKNGSSDSRK